MVKKQPKKEPFTVTLDVYGSLEKLCRRFGGKERCAEVRHRLSKLERRLRALPPRQQLALTLAAAILFLILGLALGKILASRQPLPSSNGTSSTPPAPQAVTETGILRRFSTPQEGIEFYLEGEDDAQTLLDFAGRFESAFLQKTYVGTFVTVEGVMTKSADGSKDILQVEKIVIKW